MLALLVALALSSTQCPASAHDAQLTEAEVVRIANDAAHADGTNLQGFNPPVAKYEPSRHDCVWVVFYNGVEPIPGNHFMVLVHDLTRTAEIVPGL